MKLLSIGLVLVAALFLGCNANRNRPAGFQASGADFIPDGEKTKAAFSGGDGSSLKDAIIIKGAKGEKMGVRAEYIWLHQHFPGYRLQGQAFHQLGDKAYDEIKIVTADGNPRTVFFNITSFLGDY